MLLILSFTVLVLIIPRNAREMMRRVCAFSWNRTIFNYQRSKKSNKQIVQCSELSRRYLDNVWSSYKLF